MNKLNATALLFTLCSSIISVNAYENSFFNNTDTPIGIAIQYTGNDSHEPLYKQLIKPQEMDSFLPGQAKIPNIKWGFCLDHIYYVENPTRAQKAKNFEKTIWKKIPITWTEEKSKTNKQKKRDIKKIQAVPLNKNHSVETAILILYGINMEKLLLQHHSMSNVIFFLADHAYQ